MTCRDTMRESNENLEKTIVQFENSNIIPSRFDGNEEYPTINALRIRKTRQKKG